MKFLHSGICALALMATGAAITPALAETPAPSRHVGELEVPINKSQVVTASRPIARAMIGSSEIADILPLSERSIYVLGKQFGTTSLTLYDRQNRVIAVMNVSVGPDVDGLRRQMAELIPGQTIEARLSNGSILLTGSVNDPGASGRAAMLAKSYAGDKVINLVTMGGSQQVMLEVRFAEVTRRWGEEVGVQASAQSKDGTFQGVYGNGASFTPGSTQSQTTGTSSNSSSSSNSTNTSVATIGQTGTTDRYSGSVYDFTNLGTLAGKTFTGNGNAASNGNTTAAGAEILGAISGAAASSLISTTNSLSGIFQMAPVSNGFGIFSKQFSIGNVAINAVLNAMESRGLAKTLAEPTLVALSGERASFLAGGEFPIPVVQSGSTAGGGAPISIEYKSFGVSLAFTPTVLSDKVISLVVEPEVSSLDPSASVSVNGLVIPGLRTRRASTTIELRDGESFAIAGLLNKDFQNTVRRLPLLGSLPVIGALFRSSGFSRGETELLIVVTPHLVAPLKPDQVRLPTDRIGDPKPIDVLIDGEGYHPKALPPQSGAAPSGPASAAPPAETTQPKEQRYEY